MYTNTMAGRLFTQHRLNICLKRQPGLINFTRLNGACNYNSNPVGIHVFKIKMFSDTNNTNSLSMILFFLHFFGNSFAPHKK